MRNYVSRKEKDGEIRKACCIAALLLFSYAQVHRDDGWNQNSRLDLLYAVVNENRVSINTHHANTGDKARLGENYYSDKAPGIAAIALPSFLVAKWLVLEREDHFPKSDREWRSISWITTVGSVGCITAIGGAALWLLLGQMGLRRVATPVTLSVFVGSLPFTYSTMLFSHGAVVGLLMVALYCIWPVGERTQRPSYARLVCAGFCCGLAIACEFTASIAAAAVVCIALWVSRKGVIAVILGSIPPLMLIPVYNMLCFGVPWGFGYHNLVLEQFQVMNKGLFGITFPPRWDSVVLLSVSPDRGLLFWSPVFLLALPGGIAMWRRTRTGGIILVSAVALHFFAICGYYMPDGGWALGPRHLAPILPLLAIISGFGFARFPRTGFVLGGLSIGLTGLATIIDGMPPSGMYFPFVFWHLQNLMETGFNHTLLSACGANYYVELCWCFTFLFLPFVFACVNSRRIDGTGRDGGQTSLSHNLVE